MINRDHRYKSLSLSIGQIIDMLFYRDSYNTISKIKLPDNVNPVTAHYDFEKQKYIILLESDSFEPIAHGCEIPEIDPMLWVVDNYHIAVAD